MDGRKLAISHYRALKAAFRHLVELCGGLDAATFDTRVKKSALANYYSMSPQHMGDFAPSDVVADLESAAGEPIVTRALAKLAGFRLVKASDDGDIERAEIADHEPVIMAAELDVVVARIQAHALDAAADRKLSNVELDEQIALYERAAYAVNRRHDRLCAVREARRKCVELDAATVSPIRGNAA